MEAIHPVTKKPIRLLKTEAHLYKNKKTLIWLRADPQAYTNPQRYNRWYTAVSSHQHAEAWRTVLGAYPSATILETPTASTLEWLKTKAPKQQELLFLSKAVMSAYGKDKFIQEGFVNVVCMEEMAGMFPHVLRNYTQGDPQCLTALIIAAIFRVQIFHGLSPQDLAQPECSQYAEKLGAEYSFQVTDTPTAAPEELWLIQQYFVSNKPKRVKEIQHALQKNLDCPFIDRILLLNEEDYFTHANPAARLPTHPKLYQMVTGRRLTYADVILMIQDKVPPNTIVAFSNSDIYLDETWREIWFTNLQNTFLSLLRYEEPIHPADPPQMFGPRPDSQDTWVVHSTSVQARKGTWDYDALNFLFGKNGCDNAINVEMLRKKFVVANPSLSLRTLHCHASQVRTYKKDDVVDKPIFMHLDPTGLHDLQPVQDLKGFVPLAPPAKPFTRRIHAASPDVLKTFCAMSSRAAAAAPAQPQTQPYAYEADSPNLYDPPPAQRLCTFKNAFVTPNGLVYGYDKLYLGKTQAVREAWTMTTISHMTPAIGVKSILATPLPDETASSLWSYLTDYLSKMLRLRAANYRGDMWMPRTLPRLQEFLQHFTWEESVMPVLPREPDIVGFGQEVHWLEPQQATQTTQVTQATQEDMDALRQALRGWTPEPQFPRRVVIFQDDAFITADDSLMLESALEEAGFEVNIVYPARSSPSFLLQRTLGCAFAISPPQTHGLYWLLPKGAKVLDIMMETHVQGAAAHMAGACGLEYWTALLPRTNTKTRQLALVEHVMRSMVAMAASQAHPEPQPQQSAPLNQPLPLITLPEGFKGFHGHKGDSFREMVAMWRERGWVNTAATTTSPFVWWGKPGDVLLYDRANWDWLEASPPQNCKRILAGNPDAATCPLTQTPVNQWSFWARHPKQLERRVNEGLPSFKDRPKSLVFYGKIENKVQEEHRTNALHEACDEFEMPTAEGAAYALSQEEYLDRLANAKFGLCLAGFGLKCNREIECMALGTVPLVAPDVDMDKYANPPVPGVHYIRLASFNPTNAKAIVEAMTETQWAQMSAAAHEWWKENASCEGLFRLTSRLAS